MLVVLLWLWGLHCYDVSGVTVVMRCHCYDASGATVVVSVV